MDRLLRLAAAIVIVVALAALALLALVGPSTGDRPSGGSDGISSPDHDPIRVGGALEQSDTGPDGPPIGADAASSPAFPRSAANALQDAEFVRGPTDRDFDIAAFLAEHQSPLAGQRGNYRGTDRSAAEVLGIIVAQHSISPRLILALLELESGLVDGGSPGASASQANVQGLGDRAAGMAAWLADGYYGAKYRGTDDLQFANGQRSEGGSGAGTAHFALARYLARGARSDAIEARLATFVATYDRLFGPQPVRPPAIDPAGIAQPPLLAPWAEGERWYYTGGPHGAWGIATAWGAVDFAPPSLVGCRSAPEWVIASAPGVVTWSDDGLVLVDLDEDGYDGTGWVVAYLHMATVGRVGVGDRLSAGDRVGHPSCEGGVADGAHVHYARKYNGEWLPADGGPAPLDLSGWTFTSYGSEYDGSMAHAEQGTRMAVTSRRPGETEVVSDNGPAQREALVDRWADIRDAEAPSVAGLVRSTLEGVFDGDSPSDPLGASDPGSPPGAAPSDGPAEAPTEADPTAPIAEAPAFAPAAAPSGAATLKVRLALQGRASHASPLVIGLARAGVPPMVLMGRTDDLGVSNAIDLPPSVRGVYHVTVRVAGYMPAEHVDVTLGAGHVGIDFTAGGLVALQAGEVDVNGSVDPGDAVAWLRQWRRGDAAADLDGDGSATLSDLGWLLRNLGDR